MSEFFDYDPMTGLRTDTKYDQMSGEMHVIRTADVQPVIDFTQSVANEVGLNRTDIKKGWWLYAKIPPIVELQLRAKGINIHDKNDEKRMFAEINTNYPYLKTTTGNHGGKVGLVS